MNTHKVFQNLIDQLEDELLPRWNSYGFNKGIPVTKDSPEFQKFVIGYLITLVENETLELHIKLLRNQNNEQP